MMVSLSELRACKVCGNVFSTLVGGIKISNCPQCDRSDLEIIEEDKELVQE
jgi:predicted Zn-ribbon and HTH transcriptional regulator